MSTFKLLSINNETIIANSDEVYSKGEWVLVDNGVRHLFARFIGEINQQETQVKIMRKLNFEELASIDSLNNLKKEIKEYCQNQVYKMNLDMRVESVDIIEEDNQLRISFYADNRVDFRSLAKKMASKFKKRIEFRQIGARDRAKAVGGIGPCGLILCCNRFLVDFDTISINMAKNQGLALNPTKINGQCSRLLCCLNYEDINYTQIKAKMPNLGSTIKTKSGIGKVVELNIVNESYTVAIENNETLVIDCRNN